MVKQNACKTWSRLCVFWPMAARERAGVLEKKSRGRRTGLWTRLEQSVISRLVGINNGTAARLPWLLRRAWCKISHGVVGGTAVAEKYGWTCLKNTRQTAALARPAGIILLLSEGLVRLRCSVCAVIALWRLAAKDVVPQTIYCGRRGAAARQPAGGCGRKTTLRTA